MSALADKNDVNSLNILPPEVIRILCGYLSYSDILNFRLTSKTYADAGVERLVHTLTLLYTKESFGELLNISKDPKLSKWVRFIRYSPFILDNFEEDTFDTMFTLHEAIFPDMALHESLSSLSLSPSIHHFTVYNAMLEEQKDMMRRKFSEFIFSKALPKFDNLIGLLMCPERLPGRLHQFEIRTMFPYDLYDTDLIGASYWSEGLVFLAAAANAGAKLVLLHLDNVDSETLYSFSINCAGTICSGLDGRYLRRLDISAESRIMDGQTPLVQVLQTASNLEHLSIKGRNFWEALGEKEMLCWNEVAMNVTLPKLRILRIKFAFGNSTSFSDFLMRHAKTLRSVKLSLCCLEGNFREWFDIFNTIQNDLTLDNLELARLLPNLRVRHVGEPITPLTHEYYGHAFIDLLKDRLLNKNTLATDCDLTLSELWDEYVAYVKSNFEKAELRRLELSSIPHLDLSEEDRKLKMFLNPYFYFN